MTTIYTEWTAAQERATVTVDGHDLEMAYRDEDTGDPVVFLHGIPTNSHLFREQFDAVELEFSFTGPLSELSAAFDCRCDHLGSVPDVEDGHAYETRISHGDFEDIRELLAEYASVRRCDLVERREDACVVRVTVDGAPSKLLAEAGFSLGSMSAVAGESRLIAEVPKDEDVGRVIEALRGYWSDVQLVAKRQPTSARAPLTLSTNDAGELGAAIDDVSNKMLSGGLSTLEEGLVDREVVSERPVRYTLTQRGRDLEAVLDPMLRWGREHLAGGSVEPAAPIGPRVSDGGTGRSIGGDADE